MRQQCSGCLTKQVSLGDKVFILQFSRFVGDMEPPDNQQPDHCCRNKDAGIYRHHGRAADFFGSFNTKDH
ncbi:hypothetical protein TNCV_2305501 [Trichonephila clavipes]|nr:hypothetical protein TNCV_2305501 [Trichonephila clavipes]